MGLELLAMCDEAWVFDGGRISAGMEGEIKRSQELGISLRYFTVKNGEIYREDERLAG